MMLDRLAVRLLPVLWLCTLWEKLTPADSETTSLFLILGVLGVMAGAWILGALADSAPKPRQRTPYNQLHDTPRSGLAVWDQTPDANLTPPPFMCALVKALGAGPGNRTMAFEVLLFIAAMALAWLLSEKSASFWAELHPPPCGSIRSGSGVPGHVSRGLHPVPSLLGDRTEAPA